MDNVTIDCRHLIVQFMIKHDRLKEAQHYRRLTIDRGSLIRGGNSTVKPKFWR